MWAEAKQGIVKDINENFVQLILTIGKEKTFNTYIPPCFLGAFDAEKIAFLPYHLISHVFNQNDFNWNVTPSNHHTKEFLQLYNMVKTVLNGNMYTFNFEKNEKELKEFIKSNFGQESGSEQKIQISKNNFTFVYQKWTKEVKPSINANWENLNKVGLLDTDFFLADLLSSDNKTIKEKLFVLLKKSYYELDRKLDELTGLESSSRTDFKDNQKAHHKFWNIYERPPKEEYWDFIVSRRDLLIPQDIRERKGSFFTPAIWVEKSQQYLADALGENLSLIHISEPTRRG